MQAKAGNHISAKVSTRKPKCKWPKPGESVGKSTLGINRKVNRVSFESAPLFLCKIAHRQSGQPGSYLFSCEKHTSIQDDGQLGQKGSLSLVNQFRSSNEPARVVWASAGQQVLNSLMVHPVVHHQEVSACR